MRCWLHGPKPLWFFLFLMSVYQTLLCTSCTIWLSAITFSQSWCLSSSGSQSIGGRPAVSASLGELIRNASSQVPSQIYWARNSGGGAQKSSLRSPQIILLLLKLENLCAKWMILSLSCTLESPGSFKNYWGLCPNPKDSDLFGVWLVFNLSTIDIWGWIIICWGICPVYWKMFSSIPGLYSIDVSSWAHRSVAIAKNVSRHCQSPLKGNNKKH